MTVDFSIGHIRVLIVDDSHSSRSVLKSALRDIGVRTFYEAIDGTSGADVLRHHEVDIILVDDEMSPMDGLAFLSQIRQGKTSAKASIPIVMLAGGCEPERIEAAHKAGVSEYLMRPLSTEFLIRHFRQALADTRPFVTTADYVGPCRRRADLGPLRQGERRIAPPLSPTPPLISLPDDTTRPSRTASRISRKKFPRGTVILTEGDRGDEAYVVESGRVSVFKLVDGRKVVLGELGVNGVFGEMALIDDEPRMASAEAMEDTVCLVLSQPALKAQIKRTPDLVILVLETLLQNIRTMGCDLVTARAQLREQRRRDGKSV